MSKYRAARMKAKTLLWKFMSRLYQAARARKRAGRTINDRWTQNFGRPDYADRVSQRARWRRWYRANKRHQAQYRRLRRAGCRLQNMPHSLKLNWVP